MQVLIIDDSEDDARLLALELERGGLDVVFQRVDTPDAIREALAGPPWDLILCDYSMPRCNAATVLQWYGEIGLATPLIVISGVVGEYIAAQMIQAGARDYLAKGDLAPLVPVVLRELGRPGAPRAKASERAPSNPPKWFIL